LASKKWYLVGRKLIGISILIVWLGLVLWLVTPAATLDSLEKVDDYPLYTMRYYGAYEKSTAPAQVVRWLMAADVPNPIPPHAQLPWACSLFAACGDAEHRLYGRNFDWQYSPAVLLVTHPPDGYASVSMVDIAYLGFAPGQVRALDDLPLVQRGALLYAPFLPFDGMNEYGLAVGMAAVPPGGMRPDPDKATIGSLMVIRQMLDHARDVDEAVALLGSYNIDMGGGPPLHYLIADRTGRSVLVEFYQGRMEIIPSQAPWHLATNFLRASAGESAQGRCWRYDTIGQRLAAAEGRITPQEAIDLLAEVSQASTQWSMVYEMSSGDIGVAMGRRYEAVHTFHLRLADE
jgi:hypothetical protein